MEKELKIIIANPAGNITIFVLNSCARKDYNKITTALLEQTSYDAEQVAFVLPMHGDNVDGAIDMSGMEFCGNATRSYGLVLALEGKGTLTDSGTIKNMVKISGAENPIATYSNTKSSVAAVDMPLPKSVTDYPKYNGTLVDMEGIVHLILDIKEHSPDTFEDVRDYYYMEDEPPAFGVMYYDKETHFMTPVVFVRDVNTVYHEGSCGSGTVALAAALTKDFLNKKADYTISQPAGKIDVSVVVEDSTLKNISISSKVIIYKEKTVKIKMEED